MGKKIVLFTLVNIVCVGRVIDLGLIEYFVSIKI